MPGGGGVGWVQRMGRGPGVAVSVPCTFPPGREKTPASTWPAGVDPPGLLPGLGRGQSLVFCSARLVAIAARVSSSIA